MAEQTDAGEVAIKTAADIEKNPQGIVKRWRAELALADQAEEDWRKESKEILELYDSRQSKENSFNILWSNTETLAPAVYNSTPEPDVRRRFRDADAIGKVASTALERSLSYQIDDYDFDDEINDCVLDMLLPGRGVARIVYEPHFVAVGPDGVTPAPVAGAYTEPAEQGDASGQGEPSAQSYERIVGQDARCAHVQWDDYRHGPGKRWKDVPWHAFRHEFTQEMVVEKFGKDIATKLTYSQGSDSERVEDKDTQAIFKVVEAWEIWDRDTRRVIFMAPTYADAPLAVIPDPLRLRQFFPLPRPLRAIKNTRSLAPTPIYRMYKQQALELDRTSARINKVITALKVRGAYSGHIKEAADILDADDLSMIAIENVSMIAESGGLDKLIWIMPIEKLAAVLKYLYEARNEIKQAIYEISGVADILRGATDPNETLGAQRLKSQWGSLRIQKMQKEVQRFIRDLLRLKAEVIAEQFTIEQLQAMTNIHLPDAQMKQKAQGALQQLSRQAQQTGQPAPPPPPEIQKMLSEPTWEDIKQLLTSDQMRQYRVDIETDSTVADTINQDMQGMAELVQQVGQVLAAVQQGLPMDVAKNIALSMCRRARMGSAVEDALEALQQPPPPQAEQPPPDHSIEVAQIQADNKQAIAQIQEETKTQLAQIKEQAETERQQMLDQMKAGREQQKMELEAAVKIIVAEITATKAAEAKTAANAQREFAEGVT